jgi:P-type Ca2+ transporter type 2C
MTPRLPHPILTTGFDRTKARPMPETTQSFADDAPTGLNTAEAARRLAVDGPNELPGQGPRTLTLIAREVVAEPMFLLLIAAAAIYVVLGDVREALVLAASIVIVLLITILQERRTEHALARLKDLSSPRALVIRDGVQRRIPGREVVIDDIVLLREGDRVPADGVLRSATALSADESILTGESLPIDKAAADGEAARVYSSSLIVRGFGVAQITATGARSEIGKIGRAIATLSQETTPLYREVRRIVRWVAVVGLALCALIAVFYALSRNDWLGGVLAGLTVAMGVLPEEFPVVLTVFLAMGAWRISRAGVLTRRMPAVESIGAATVLAVDKTGTLTENRMRLALIESAGDSVDLRRGDAPLDEYAASVLDVALAACERDAFDPMDRAVHEAAQRLRPWRAQELHEAELVREYDLTPELLAVTHVWRRPQATAYEVAVKGAPETVLDLCRVDQSQRAALLNRVAARAQQGLRVLGVAQGAYREAAMPSSPREFELQFLGFVCLADPLRGDVPAALADCAQAGIRVVMITGDHPGTALTIGAQAGFDTRGGALTGADLEKLSDEELRRCARSVNIYARAKPEHKLLLVQAFKANGEVIVMTGDGVNDAPALKAAHVGVAMGGRGTDVAREAAALVLVNDDFASLVAAVHLGRRIYSNIRHAMSYIVSVHIPIAGLGLLPVVFGWPLLFFPVHVLFLEFVIDPACAFVFEADPASDDVMRRKPRRPDERLFSRAMLKRSVLLGAIVLAFSVVVYGVALTIMGEGAARALAFVGLVIANLALIFVSRSRSATFAALLTKSNNIFWWVGAVAFLALALTVYAPPIAALFLFTAPQPATVGVVAGCAVMLVLTAGGLLRERP